MKILLTILLFLGKFFLLLLLLILLLILILLFVPFRYRLDTAKDQKEIFGGGTISFLFSAIQVSFSIAGNVGDRVKRDLDIIIFGISRNSIKEKRKEAEKKKSQRKKQERIEALKREDPQKYEELKQEAKARREQKKAILEPEEKSEEVSKESDSIVMKSAHPDRTLETKTTNSNKAAAGVLYSILQRLTTLISNGCGLVTRAFTRLLFAPIRVIVKLFDLSERWRNIKAGLSEIASFLRDERLWGAVKSVGIDLKKIIKHLSPKKISGRLQYGFEDPSITGSILAALSLIPFVYRNELELYPDFETEETHIDGELHLKGRLYLFYLLWIAVTLLLNKNVRCVISYIRGRENKEEEE